MAADLPPSLGQLVTELVARGFAIVSERRDDANFGNRLVELTNPNRETTGAIRLVRDRGLWSVEVAIGGKWRDPYRQFDREYWRRLGVQDPRAT